MHACMHGMYIMFLIMFFYFPLKKTKIVVLFSAHVVWHCVHAIDSGQRCFCFSYVIIMLQIIYSYFCQFYTTQIFINFFIFLSLYNFLIALQNACHVFLSSRTFIYELSMYNFNYVIFQGFFNSL